YLTFRFPEKYFLYKSSFYKELCKVLKVKPVQAGERLLHYLSLAEEAKQKYIVNNTELQELHDKIYPKTDWNDDNLITQNLFYCTLERSDLNTDQYKLLPGADEFLEVVHSHDRADVDHYFEFLDAIIEKFDIEEDD